MKQHVIIKFFFSFFLLATILTSCEKDYYDPSTEETKTISDIFGEDFTIPESFDWNNTQTVNITVKVDDQYNSEYYYVVEVYDSNPLFDTNAILLSKGVAKEGQDFVTTTTIAKALQAVYIKQTDPAKNEIVGYLDINSQSLVYDFGNNTASNPTKSFEFTSSNNTETYSLRAGETYTVPADATPIVNGGHLDLAAGAYVIANLQGSLSFGGSTSKEIYITGNVALSNNFQLPSNCKLIILSGGSFSAPSLEILENTLLNNAGTLTVAGNLKTSNGNGIIENTGNGSIAATNITITNNNSALYNLGTVNVSSTIQITNNGKIENSGNITTNDLIFDNGGIVNGGTILVHNETNLKSDNTSIENNKSFTTKSLNLTWRGVIINTCHFEVTDKSNLNGSTITVGAGGLFKTNSMSIEQTNIELGKDAIFKVDDTATLKYNNKIIGTGNNAFLIMNTAIRNENSNNNVIYDGNLYIKCNSHFAEKKDNWNIYYTQTSGVKWGDYPQNIADSGCNDGGYKIITEPTEPTNPSFPIISDGGEMTYLFEDNWPSLGDYDMNDLVINVEPSYSQNSANQVETLTLKVVLRAVGASKRLAAGIQLDGVNSSLISNVSRSDDWLTGSVFSSDFESGSNAVIPLFDDAHATLGESSAVLLNTIKGGASKSSASTTITITFNTPVSTDKINVSKLNIFAVNGGTKGKRSEIHMYGYAPTANSNSSGTTFRSADKLVWVLGIPNGFSYPLEYVNIKDAYPEFESWASSGGSSSADWYKSPSAGKVY